MNCPECGRTMLEGYLRLKDDVKEIYGCMNENCRICGLRIDERIIELLRKEHDSSTSRQS